MNEKQDLLSGNLQVDLSTTPHLKETARWAKFISICGMVFSGIALIFAVTMGGRIESALNNGFMDSGGAGFLLILLVILFAIVYFIMNIFLYSFANKIQLAIATSDRYEFNMAMKKLKTTYQVMGILFSLLIFLNLLNTIIEIAR